MPRSAMRAVPVLSWLAFALAAFAAPACAAGPDQSGRSEGAQEEKLSPEETMRARHPQPVRAGDLVGRALLDEHDRTLGRVRHVVRTTEGKILLIVPHGGLFGLGERLVPVPIEVVAALGSFVLAVDMPRAAFVQAPTWYGAGAEQIGDDEVIRIAITRK